MSEYLKFTNISSEQETQIPEHFQTVSDAQKYVENLIRNQRQFLEKAQPRQIGMYETTLQALGRLNTLLKSDPEVAEQTLKEIQNNWEGNRSRLYEYDIDQYILNQLVNKYFSINSELFGLTTGEAHLGEGNREEGFEKPELNQEYFTNLMMILESLGNKERHQLVNVKYTRGQYNPETIRGYSYTIIELTDKEIIITESFVRGNALYVVDIQKLPADVGNPREFILTRSKDELNDSEYAMRYEHRAGYVELVVQGIQFILGSRNVVAEGISEPQLEQQEGSIQENYEEGQEFEDWMVRRWDELIDFLREHGRRPSHSKQEDALEAQLSGLLGNYISQDVKLGLSTSKEKELIALLNALDSVNKELQEARWGEIITFMQRFNKKPSTTSKDPLERYYANLLRTYIKGRTQKGLSSEDKITLDKEITRIDQELKEGLEKEWDELIHFLERHDERPNKNSKDSSEVALAIKLDNYMYHGRKNGLTVAQDQRLSQLMEAIDLVKHELSEGKWILLRDFLKTYERYPSRKSSDPSEQALSHVFLGYQKEKTKIALPEQDKIELVSLITKIKGKKEELQRTRWDKIIMSLESGVKITKSSKDPEIQYLAVTLDNYKRGKVTAGLSEVQKNRLDILLKRSDI